MQLITFSMSSSIWRPYFIYDMVKKYFPFCQGTQSSSKLLNIGFIFFSTENITNNNNRTWKMTNLLRPARKTIQWKLMFDAVKHPTQHGFIITYISLWHREKKKEARDSCRVPADWYYWHTKRNCVHQCDKVLTTQVDTDTSTEKKEREKLNDITNILMYTAYGVRAQKEPFSTRWNLRGWLCVCECHCW